MLEKITPRVTSVGVDNTKERKFENQYVLYHGMAYNSYVVKGEDKTAVIDAVEEKGFVEWRTHLVAALEGEMPDYLIVQHMEPDHSATILDFCEIFPDVRIVCSAKAAGMLNQFFPDCGLAERVIAVKEGDKLELGGVTLQFLAAPMIHWPEVMMTYCPEERVFFSADAFGKFGAVGYEDDWINEARRYYTNIVGKYGAQVQSLLKKAAGLEIHTIAPLHGPVLSENLGYYIGLYHKWSTYTPEEDGVLIAYASVYGGTAEAALLLGSMLMAMGVKVITFDLCNQPVSEAVAQAFRYSKMILASVTYDGGLFPAMHDFLYHLASKGFKNRRVGLVENGSWAPVAAKMMAGMLEKMKGMKICENVFTIKSRLNNDTDREPMVQFIHSFLSE